MPRAKIPYEEVEQEATLLFKSGVPYPSVSMVREVLKSKRLADGKPIGSPGSIQEHLAIWRQKNQIGDRTAPPPPLPNSITAEINRFLQTSSNQAREDQVKKLEVVNEELLELAQTSAEYESRIDELTKEVGERTYERDVNVGQGLEHVAQIKALTASVEGEMARGAGLRQELARCEYTTRAALDRAEAADHREHTLQNQIDQLQAELLLVRTAKAEAEKNHEIAKVRLEIEERARYSAESQIEDLLKAVGGIEGAAGRATAAEAVIVELRGQISMLHELLPMGKPGRSSRRRARADAPPKYAQEPSPN